MEPARWLEIIEEKVVEKSYGNFKLHNLFINEFGVEPTIMVDNYAMRKLVFTKDNLPETFRRMFYFQREDIEKCVVLLKLWECINKHTHDWEVDKIYVIQNKLRILLAKREKEYTAKMDVSVLLKD